MKKLSRAFIVASVVGAMTLAGSVPSQAAGNCTPISKELGNARLGKLYAYAVDLTTNKVLVNVRSTEQTPSASVMKTITMAAAVKYIVKPHEAPGQTPYVATTSVLTDPSQPGVLILRGGGDHTLTRVGPNSITTYYSPGHHPAKLRVLAQQSLAALPAGTQITKIILDDSFFKGPIWNPNWPSYSMTSGNAAPITGLMVDAARTNPDQTDLKYSGVRVADPTLQAGTYFKQWLGDAAANAVLVKGVTPRLATVLTSANSQPITNWITHALKISDNTETEVIARHTELAMGLPNNFTSVQKMGSRLFSSLGLDGKKLVMKDASGLAPNDRVTAKLVASLLKVAADPTSPIAELPTFMSTSGDGGTLGGRFSVYNKTTKTWDLVIPNGKIRAKTGYISGLYGLAGILTTPESHTIVFAMFAGNDPAHKKFVGAGTKTAIDGVVEKLYLCGATL